MDRTRGNWWLRSRLTHGKLNSTMISHTIGTIQRKTEAKEKKSFTLSQSSVAFLMRLREERKAPSASMVLDELIQEADALQRRSSTDQAISEYYSSLSGDEINEQEAWGKFAVAQLRKESQ